MGKRLPRPAVLQRFGRLRVIIPEGRKTNTKGKATNGYAALCICDCRELVAVRWTELYTRGTQSCGCLQKDELRERATSHGMNDSREYNIWQHIKKRCLDPKTVGYHNYGGRGITVCDRWLNSFEAFYSDMGPCPGKGYSIERRDNEKGYEPGNCKWATQAEQSRNTRRNIRLIVNGISMVLAEAAHSAGLKPTTVFMRRRNGWPPSRWLEPYTSDVQLVS
jgi:hypothetical protein